MNVYIHKPVNYSDMQGPCAEGFHVPSENELTLLLSDMVSLGISVDGWKTYLKTPFTGALNRTTGAKYDSSSGLSLYFSANAKSTNAMALCFTMNGASVDIRQTLRAMGCIIRPFKDVPVIPDSDWVALYSDKIYHNATLGLISISSDGTNWITIADKNLGATTVYNSGDTMSEANCGKFYQWGNNYGFPFTGATTTSSTKVDASAYGPGNYYSSSTFITTSGSPNDWSSVQNDNLRGGVTGVGGESELKNAYIGNGLS